MYINILFRVLLFFISFDNLVIISIILIIYLLIYKYKDKSNFNNNIFITFV